MKDHKFTIIGAIIPSVWCLGYWLLFGAGVKEFREMYFIAPLAFFMLSGIGSIFDL